MYNSFNLYINILYNILELFYDNPTSNIILTIINYIIMNKLI